MKPDCVSEVRTVRQMTRLIRKIEDNYAEAKSELRGIYQSTQEAYVLGITGPPGAGKSTIINQLIENYYERGNRIGVLLVDPSSPFSGGAIMGDRLRLKKHISNPDIFIRSMATRNATGGLSHATGAAIRVLEAMGKDIIIVETVGAGQQDIEIANYAHTTVVVQVPGLGDGVQAIKAGILEIADIFVVNKSHSEGAVSLYADLVHLSHLSKDFTNNGWEPRVVELGNITDGKGFDAEVAGLMDAIEQHRAYLAESNTLLSRRKRRVELELKEALHECVFGPMIDRLKGHDEYDRIIGELLRKETDPYTSAEKIFSDYIKEADVY